MHEQHPLRVIPDAHVLRTGRGNLGPRVGEVPQPLPGSLRQGEEGEDPRQRGAHGSGGASATNNDLKIKVLPRTTLLMVDKGEGGIGGLSYAHTTNPWDEAAFRAIAAKDNAFQTKAPLAPPPLLLTISPFCHSQDQHHR